MFHHQIVPVLENVPIARDTFRIRLACPDIARAVVPGQFVMVRVPGITDPLLGRPFALYDTVLDKRGTPCAIDVVYLVVGKMTRLLSTLAAGDQVEVWGPLGNGFRDLEVPNVALVAGGIGQTPFLAYIRHLLGSRGYAGRPAVRRVQRISLYYGVRAGEFAAGIDDFTQAGAEVHVASNDGSMGFHGHVTQLVETQPLPDAFVGCGPEPMMHALAHLAQERGVRCDLSLESPMACGIGVCFSCVTRVKTPEGWDYKRVCMDGPVFDAAQLVLP